MVLKKLFSVCLLLLLHSVTNAQTFTLKGTIKGKDSGIAKLRYFRDGINQNKTDTVIIKDGKFHFTGEITGADFANFSTDKDTPSKREKYGAFLLLEPGTITMDFNNGDADLAVIKGSTPQKEYEKMLKKQRKIYAKIKSIDNPAHVLKDSVEKGWVDMKVAKEKIDALYKQSQPYRIELRNKELQYVKNNPDSYVSFLLLYGFVGRLPNDSIDDMYGRLSPKIKGSTLDYRFLEYNAEVRKAFGATYPFDKIVLNKAAPVFTIKNNKFTNNLDPEHFKGKVLLIEFWGLSCYPCLKVNPHLEDMRKRHGNEKMEIVGITETSNGYKGQLLNYIKNNKFSEWVHVSLDKDFEQGGTVINTGEFDNYAGLGVPRTIVIDKEGKVIYTNYGYSSEELETLKAVVDKAINK